METNLLSTRQVAEMCNVSSRCILDWVKCGRIPGAMRLGGVYRFDKKDIKKWMLLQKRRQQEEAKKCQFINEEIFG